MVFSDSLTSGHKGPNSNYCLVVAHCNKAEAWFVAKRVPDGLGSIRPKISCGLIFCSSKIGQKILNRSCCRWLFLWSLWKKLPLPSSWFCTNPSPSPAPTLPRRTRNLPPVVTLLPCPSTPPRMATLPTASALLMATTSCSRLIPFASFWTSWRRMMPPNQAMTSHPHQYFARRRATLNAPKYSDELYEGTSRDRASSISSVRACCSQGNLV